jgi:uncharacterized protein (DUF983 family)
MEGGSAGDAYGDLELPPVVPGTERPVPAGRAIARGLLRRCPRCGEGRLFARFLKIKERCPRCRFRLEREEGGFLGAMTINFAVATTLWVILLVAWLIVDLPDLHAMRLTIASLALMTIAPLALWGHSKTVWASIDYLVYRSDPAYLEREAADRAWNA